MSHCHHHSVSCPPHSHCHSPGGSHWDRQTLLLLMLRRPGRQHLPLCCCCCCCDPAAPCPAPYRRWPLPLPQPLLQPCPEWHPLLLQANPTGWRCSPAAAAAAALEPGPQPLAPAVGLLLPPLPPHSPHLALSAPQTQQTEAQTARATLLLLKQAPPALLRCLALLLLLPSAAGAAVCGLHAGPACVLPSLRLTCKGQSWEQAARLRPARDATWGLAWEHSTATTQCSTAQSAISRSAPDRSL